MKIELEIEELSRLIEMNKSLQNENERLERDLGIEKDQIKVNSNFRAENFELFEPKTLDLRCEHYP